MPVTIYTRTTCAPCKMLKQWFNNKGITFTEKNVDEDREAAEEALARSGLMTVPVTMIGDQVITGPNIGLISKLLMV